MGCWYLFGINGKGRSIANPWYPIHKCECFITNSQGGSFDPPDNKCYKKYFGKIRVNEVVMSIAIHTVIHNVSTQNQNEFKFYTLVMDIHY